MSHQQAKELQGPTSVRERASGANFSETARGLQRPLRANFSETDEWMGANFTETGQPPLDRIDAFLARGIQTEP